LSFSSTEDLLKVLSDSIERIRHSTSADERQSIVISTVEFLKLNDREDLCKRFTNEIAKETNLNTEDNLNEENMEVDDEQDKKQLAITEYNDVDYRFLDQDMDHRMPPIITPENERQRAHIFSSDLDADDRTIKSNLMEERRDKRTTIDSDFRKSDTKITSPR